jgi:hypothetical protein
MKRLGILALAFLVLLPQPVAASATPEFDAYAAVVVNAVQTTNRHAKAMTQCSAWPCMSQRFVRIDGALTAGIQWLYQHPALPCYQEQQQKVTKVLQELRGGYRQLSLAVQTGDAWRKRVAKTKIGKAMDAVAQLPPHSCPL